MQCAASECRVTFKWIGPFKLCKDCTDLSPHLVHGGHNWVIPGPRGESRIVGGVQQQHKQEGVKWRGHRPPTLARSVLAAQLFSVQSRPSGCSGGGEPAPQHTVVRPQSPPSGLLLAALSPTLGLRTAASAATRPTCTFDRAASRGETVVEKSNLFFG